MESSFRSPMLAKDYDGNAAKLVFPLFVQPKLDGVRCITDGRTFWSRNGKKFPLINLKHLRTPTKLTTLIDGELMVHGSEDFEDIVSAVKNGSTLDRTLSNRIRLHVFDVMTDDAFKVRKAIVAMNVSFAREHGAKWERVYTLKVNSPQELKSVADRFLEHGFEGTMLRTVNGLYVSKRTRDLRKWKPLMEAEFEITDIKEAKGKDAGTPIFICSTGGKKPVTFRARPMGTTKQRRKMWRERKKLIGQLLTVEFQNLTKYGKPRFPRAKVLRNYE